MLGLSEISEAFRERLTQHGIQERFFLLRASMVATFPKIPKRATKNTPTPRK